MVMWMGELHLKVRMQVLIDRRRTCVRRRKERRCGGGRGLKVR